MAKKWSKSSYGKTALTAKFTVPDLSGFFAQIEALGKNIDDACKKAVDATLPIIEKSMIEGAERHRDKGEVVDAIETIAAKQQGDFIYGQVGINLDKHPEAFEGVFQEYGDGHSDWSGSGTGASADPFIRPAIDDNRREINKVIKQTLKKEGMPVE